MKETNHKVKSVRLAYSEKTLKEFAEFTEMKEKLNRSYFKTIDFLIQFYKAASPKMDEILTASQVHKV